MFSFGNSSGTAFQDLIDRYSGLAAYLLVLWMGRFSLPLTAYLVLLVGLCSINSSLMFWGFSFSIDLWVNVASCTVLLWSNFRNRNFWREAVAVIFFAASYRLCGVVLNNLKLVAVGFGESSPYDICIIEVRSDECVIQIYFHFNW